MLWIGITSLPPDGSWEAPTTALCSIVDQLDTARRFISNEVTRAKCPVVLNSIEYHLGGIIMICVGIDVAKDKHDCFIMNSEGEVLADVFTVPNSREGFEFLLRQIRSCTSKSDKIKVGLEATGPTATISSGFFLTTVCQPLSSTHCTPTFTGRASAFAKPRLTVSTRGRLQLCSCLMWTSSPTQTNVIKLKV